MMTKKLPSELADYISDEVAMAIAETTEGHQFDVIEPVMRACNRLTKDKGAQWWKRHNLNPTVQWQVRLAEWVAGEIKLGNSFRALEEAKTSLKYAEEEFEKRFGITFDEHISKLVKTAAKVPMPPLTSALNVEAATMGFAYFLKSMGYENDLDVLYSFWGSHEEAITPDRRHLAKLCVYHKKLVNEFLYDGVRFFLADWISAAYPRLEVGHKLAASLCLTGVTPDLSVTAPWPAWALVVPDGLFDDVARVWLIGSQPQAYIRRDGHATTEVSPLTREMIQALAVGCCLALSNPEEFKREKQGSSRGKGNNRSGAPDLTYSKFLLSAPISVDLRPHVRAALEHERSGRKGVAPKVQFLVRGHWRQQAHGPQKSLRKTIWIKPFWKGPEESAVLLRNYKVEE
jgi:hypothetical protein